MGLSGGMVWSLEFDDFRGKCGDGKYPLLTKIYDMLNGKLKDHFEVPPPIPTSTPPTTPEPTTRRPTTTQEPTTTKEPTTTRRPTTSEPTELPTQEPTGSSTQYPEGTTIIDGHLFVCPKQGYFKHPTNRHKFVECLYLNSHWQIYVMECKNGTIWNDSVKACVNDNQVENPNSTTHLPIF